MAEHNQEPARMIVRGQAGSFLCSAAEIQTFHNTISTFNNNTDVYILAFLNIRRAHIFC